MFEPDLVFELFKLEVCVVVQVIYATQLLFQRFHLLGQLRKLWRVCLSQLLELALHVFVDLLLKAVQVRPLHTVRLVPQFFINL